MLHRVVWLLLATIPGLTSQDLRIPRQLDLGPETPSKSPPPPSAQQSQFQQPGYLPPIEPAGAQNDPVIIGTTPKPGPTHHGRDLCTDPFHSFLCSNLKQRKPITGALPQQKPQEFVGANTFLEPSKVLAPPFNDLEEPSTTTTRQAPTTTTTTTTTTTPRPTTQPPTTTTRRPSTSERPVAPEASNDVRSYLPPEQIAPAAAQQDLTVVKPDEEHNHHHHPHHHGRDLCSDPFHSFLCQPLKARKRITGDLPNSLQGQNSFLAPKKILPEPSNQVNTKYIPPVEPQPSNIIDRAYLPPSTTQKPTTTTTRRPTTTTTRRPITTTRRPVTIRFRPEPSNEIERAYLPPLTTRRPPPPPPTTTRRPPPPPPTTTRRPPPPPLVQPQPSNVDRAYLPPIIPQPSNVDKNYLPPDANIEPAAAQNDPAIAKPDDHDHHHHHRDICSDPFHSFLCVSPKPRVRITGALPERFRNLAAPSNVDETRVRVLTKKTKDFKISVVPDVEVPQPSQQLDTKVRPGYDYPKPELFLPSETRNEIIPTTSQAPKTTGYAYPTPDNKLTLPSDIKPVVSGYNYPKPEKKLPLPSEQRNEIIATTTTRKPTTGYNYPKPEVKLPLPTEIKPQIIGYDYPKPDKKLPLPSAIRNEIVVTTSTRKPTSGYNYPKPEKKFPLPSEVRNEIIATTTTRKPTTGYNYPKPDIRLTLPSEIKPQVTGYNYPQPEKKFPLPSEVRNEIVSTTTTTTTARPTTTRKPTTGYNYPTPDVRLNLPTEIKPQVTGYNYPTPQVKLTLPSGAQNEIRSTPKPKTKSGYSYPAPSPSLPLPTENQFNKVPSQRNSLPTSISEAKERLQVNKVTRISNISDQNSSSDLIPVNDIVFPGDGEGGLKFGQRLKKRERKTRLVPPPGSFPFQF